jgi:hypothetical protein
MLVGYFGKRGDYLRAQEGTKMFLRGEIVGSFRQDGRTRRLFEMIKMLLQWNVTVERTNKGQSLFTARFPAVSSPYCPDA